MGREPLLQRVSPFLPWPCDLGSASGISTTFAVLSRPEGQVAHVLLTRPPLTVAPKGHDPFDLHVLSTPPAFVLSQDQTLTKLLGSSLFGSLLSYVRSLFCCSVFKDRAGPHRRAALAATSVTILRAAHVCNRNVLDPRSRLAQPSAARRKLRTLRATREIADRLAQQLGLPTVVLVDLAQRLAQ